MMLIRQKPMEPLYRHDYLEEESPGQDPVTNRDLGGARGSPSAVSSTVRQASEVSRELLLLLLAELVRTYSDDPRQTIASR